MYKDIYEFCKVKNKGTCFKNGSEPTPRVKFITELCDREGIKYEVDEWGEASFNIDEVTILDTPDIIGFVDRKKDKEAISDLYSDFLDVGRQFLENKGISMYPDELESEVVDSLGDEYIEIVSGYTEKLREIIEKYKDDSANKFFNIMLLGSSDKFVTAHHDIVNPESDNANDNSCSVINAIAIKKMRPEINVVLLDGEEVGGIGSKRLSERIKSGDFSCKWILNLELTGKGGKNFFVGDMGSPLTTWIQERFDCPLVKVPFNDSVIFNKFGINSTVINPLPITEKEGPIVNKDGQFLDYKMLFNCHRMSDSVETIDPNDMKEFVEEICLKIIDEA
jgi:hypothetical protein